MKRRKSLKRARSRKLSGPALRKYILREARKLQTENLGDADPMQPVDASAEEYEAGEEADQLEKDIDHIKALKIEETKLINRLRRLREVKKIVKKRMLKKI